MLNRGNKWSGKNGGINIFPALVRGILWDNPFRPWFLWTLLIVNGLGSVYGYWWYHGQLAATPFLWWPFTPDSPRSSTLMTLAVLILLTGTNSGLGKPTLSGKGRGAGPGRWEPADGRETSLPFSSRVFLLWAYLEVLKYGLWAVIVISDFWLRGAPVEGVEMILWLSHLGMALEGFLFWRHLRYRLPEWIAVVIWMLVNDYLDYGPLNLHPYLFRPDQRELALLAAAGLSLFLAVAALARSRRHWPE